MSIEIYLKVIKIAGYTIPVVTRGGYVTISIAGRIELWYYKPTLSHGYWGKDNEIGIDIAEVSGYRGEPEIVEIIS